MNKEVFCYAPWISLQNDPRGFFNVCCLYGDYTGIGNVSSGWKAAWNSEKLKEIREGFKSKNNQFTSNCKHCITYESLGYSQRQSCLQLYKDSGEVSLTDSIKRGPIFLDLRFSTLCNQSCIMCGPHASSRWSAELGLKNSKFSCRPLVDLVQDNIETVKVIRFAGGEPLICQEHYDILNLMLEKGRTDVKLIYNTNLSTTNFKNQDICQLWKEFKDKEITISVDATGVKNNYIRYGSSWESFKENCQKLKNCCSFEQVYFHPTIQVLNVLELPNLYRFVESIGFSPLNLIWGNLLDKPQALSLKALPLLVQEHIFSVVDSNTFCEDLKEHWQRLQTTVYRETKNIDVLSSISETMLYLDWIDSLHGTSWRKIFPEITECFIKCLNLHGKVL